jgi:glutamyl-Q tRNA(Asp) synthetase
MTTPQPTFRFAPSPNGELHRGHAYSALVNARLAGRFDGRLLLRIEDVDHGRARPEFEAQIYDDLAWLGLQWEEPVLRQSEEIDYYRFMLDRLDEAGVLYYCFASRKDIAAHPDTAHMPLNPDGAPLYPGIYRNYERAEALSRIEAGEPYQMRLDMRKALALAHDKVSEIAFAAWQPDGGLRKVAADPAVWGDVILGRRDAPTSYTLAVVVDDARQGVTHVVRGMDLYHATSLQRLVQILLDLPAPVYYHHQLVLDESGRKLSKSARDESLRALRAGGLAAEQLILQLPPLPLD